LELSMKRTVNLDEIWNVLHVVSGVVLRIVRRVY
jgi:hypothetical protein